MGFQIGRKFKLDFGEVGETDLAGATVRMRSASIDTLIEVQSPDIDLDRECEIIAGHVIEWDLEDGGVPLPVEAASIRKLDPPARALIYNEWMKATRGISAPFDRRSAGGVPSPAEDEPEPFIQMEPPSDSPPTP